MPHQAFGKMENFLDAYHSVSKKCKLELKLFSKSRKVVAGLTSTVSAVFQNRKIVAEIDPLSQQFSKNRKWELPSCFPKIEK